jgi:hypothetical protein
MLLLSRAVSKDEYGRLICGCDYVVVVYHGADAINKKSSKRKMSAMQLNRKICRNEPNEQF